MRLDNDLPNRHLIFVPKEHIGNKVAQSNGRRMTAKIGA